MQKTVVYTQVDSVTILLKALIYGKQPNKIICLTYKTNQMIRKCPFLNQLRYCYASAEIIAEGADITIRFAQELNIENGIDALRFLVMPLCELSEIDCSYNISIHTPSVTYLPCLLRLQQGKISIDHHQSFSHIGQAS